MRERVAAASRMCISDRERRFRRFVKPSRTCCRRGLRRGVDATRRSRHPRGLRATRDARSRRARRRAPAASRGTMPWPRLKTCPGAGPAARTTRSASRATVAASVVQHQRIEIALQRDAIAVRAARGGEIDGPVEAHARRRRIAASSSSQSAGALGEHDRRHRAARRRRRERAKHVAHRRERKAPVRVAGQQPAPGVEDHHRVGARARSARRGTPRPRAR